MNGADGTGLEVDHLRVEAPGGAPLLRGVSLRARPGVPLTILGETGSGKTLVAEAVMGTLAPELRATGTIRVCGVAGDADDRSGRRPLWGRRLALLPQEPWLALDPTMRARAQVAETYRFVAGRPARGARREAEAALAALGLPANAARCYPSQLSGGMAQRVAIAASRAGGAPVLLADEPTKGLDSERRDAVVALLRGALDRGGTLLAITHDTAVARGLGGEVAVMLDGSVIEHGPAEKVLSAPEHPYTKRLLAAEPRSWPDAPRSAMALAAGPPVVAAERLALSAGGRTLVTGLDLVVGASEWVAVTGPSGCGKTSLGNALLGLRRPAAGRVLRAPGTARTGFQKLYQDPVAAFPPGVALRTVLGEAARLHRVPWPELETLLGRLRVAGALLDRRPDQVSGGELQRVAIARALLPRPVFLFADEPTSRLDLITQQDTLAVLGDASAERGCAVVLVTHDAEMARKAAARVVRLGGAEAA